MQTVTDPSVYLEKLAIYLDKKQMKKVVFHECNCLYLFILEEKIA